MRRSLVAALVAMVLLGVPAYAQLFPSNPFPDQPTPAPELMPSATRPPSSYGDFVDMWGRTGEGSPTTIGISISEYGVGNVVWTTGSEPPGTMAAGRASGWFKPPQGRTITGEIFQTNDANVIARGAVSLTMVSAYVAHLAQGSTTWTVCSATLAGQALADGKPEPPCVDP